VRATLVHERVHCRQEHTGTPVRNGDHTREGVGRMQAIGLEPVVIDGTGGTGQRVTHTIIAGGQCAAACETLTESADWQGLTLTRIDEATAKTGGRARAEPEGRAPAARRTPGKVKSASPGRRVTPWGKPGLELAAAIDGQWVALAAP